jgi:hypothetical protein
MSEYPLVMNHPHFVPAKVQRPTANAPLLPGEEPQEPQAAIFPPVIVSDESQENQHRALGYLAAGEVLDDYVPLEYPKWVDPETLVKSEVEEDKWRAAHDKPSVAEENAALAAQAAAIASDVPA